MIPARIIATRLVKKRIRLHRQIEKFNIHIQIHTTASGGTSDAAIATQANHAAILLNQKARNRVMSIAEIIHTAILEINNHSHFQKSLLFHVVVAKATAWIGLRIGAISIAQITTGVALMRSHNDAIIDESTIWLQYSIPVSTSFMIVSATSVFWSHHRFQIAILSKSEFSFSWDCSFIE